MRRVWLWVLMGLLAGVLGAPGVAAERPDAAHLPEVSDATVASCCHEHWAKAPRSVTVSVTPTVSERNAETVPSQPGLVAAELLIVTPDTVELTASAAKPAACKAAPRLAFAMVPLGRPGPENTHCLRSVRLAGAGVFVTVQVTAPFETASPGKMRVRSVPVPVATSAPVTAAVQRHVVL